LEALALSPPRGGAHKTFKAALTIEMDERDFGACYWRMWACLRNDWGFAGTHTTCTQVFRGAFHGET
jgi:hypothetical protein